MSHGKHRATARGSPGRRRRATDREATGREATGREATGREATGREATGREATDRRPAARAAAARGEPGRKATGREAPGRKAADRGAATVWTVGGLALLMAVTTVMVWFCAAVVTRHRAASAADLAALAAAGKVVDGERRACGRARRVAEEMSVVLRSCRLSGWDALVEVVAVPPGVLGHFGSAAARARAGPVEETGDARQTVVRTR